MKTLAKQTEKQQNGLNNLKAIFGLQRNGTVQILLRDLRSSKSQLDELINSLNNELQRKLSATLDNNAQGITESQETSSLAQNEKNANVNNNGLNKNQNIKTVFDKKRDFSQKQDRNASNKMQHANTNRPNQNRYNQNNRPFGTRTGTKNFVSSKANSFKVFEPMESSSVLSQPERNYGNKNKSNRTLDEKRQTNKKSLLRKNFMLQVFLRF